MAAAEARQLAARSAGIEAARSAERLNGGRRVAEADPEQGWWRRGPAIEENSARTAICGVTPSSAAAARAATATATAGCCAYAPAGLLGRRRPGVLGAQLPAGNGRGDGGGGAVVGGGATCCHRRGNALGSGTSCVC